MLLIRALLVILFFQALCTSAFSQSDGSYLDWYESFFTDKDSKPVETSLTEAAEQLNNAASKEEEVRWLLASGLLHLTKTFNYEQAMEYFIRSLAIEDSLGLREERVITYLAIGEVFFEVGDYQKSEQFLKEALAANEPTGNKAVLIFTLNKLGSIYSAMGRTDDALENFEMALEYKEDSDDPRREAEVLSNMATVHQMQGKYQEALKIHKQALALRRSVRDRANEALSLNDIGELYVLMKNEERALANHLVALDIRQRLEDKRGIAESFNNIGILYFQQKRFEQAILNLEKALQAGRESAAQDQIRTSADYLSQAHKEIGNFQKALEYRDLYLAINEFIQNERYDRQLLEAQNRYVLEKQESQIEALEAVRKQREQQLKEEQQFRNFLFLIIGLCVIIVCLVFYLYLIRKRSEKKLAVAHQKVQQQNVKLQELNATKDKFFSIISHDLKGPLNSLTSFSGLLINHTDSLSKEEIQMLATDFDKSLKNLFALLENLLEWSRSQTGNIEFRPEVFDLAALLEENKTLLQGQAQNKNITILNGDGTSVHIHAHKHSVNTVIRNLISNAIKFTPEGGAVTLNLQAGKDEALVTITDTGVGMGPEVIQKLFRIDTKHSTKGTANEKGTGLGLILCKEFIEKNGGNIGVKSAIGEGSAFYFTLPLATKHNKN